MLILFDIDGTLLHSKRVGSTATRLAMQEMFGTVGKLDEFRFGGKTDWQMLLETLEGIVPAPEIERLLPEYDVVLARHVTAIIGNFTLTPCVGAEVLLQRLAASPDFTVGVMTANMPSTAALKLQAAGYDPAIFELGAYGSEAIQRTALVPIAVQRARTLKQRDFAPQEVVIIGDTPDDIACAAAIGGRAIATATGQFSYDELVLHKPMATVENLADTDAIWALIYDHAAP